MRKLLAISALLIALKSSSAIFTVTYETFYENGGPYNWIPQAQAAFERVVEVVEESICLPFEIKIIAYYEDPALKHGPKTYAWILGYARASAFAQDFGSHTTAVLQCNQLY